MRKYRNEEWLREQYIKKGRKVQDIADECDVDYSTIYNWINEFDFEKREQQGVGRYTQKDWLREKYVQDRLSTRDISELCDASRETIRRWLDEHGIKKRTGSEAIEVQWENAEQRRQQASDLLQNLRESGVAIPPHEERGTWEDEDYLEMLRYRTGEDNPNWRGGYDGSYASHTGWRRIREDVLERDGYECQVCESEGDLDVHHIIPVREFDTPKKAHYPENLVSLCKSCHPKVESGEYTLERVA